MSTCFDTVIFVSVVLIDLCSLSCYALVHLVILHLLLVLLLYVMLGSSSSVFFRMHAYDLLSIVVAMHVTLYLVGYMLTW